MQEFINFTLHYIADLDIPIKRWAEEHSILKEVLNIAEKLLKLNSSSPLFPSF